MPSDDFGKISSGVSKNISTANSSDVNKIQPQSTNPYLSENSKSFSGISSISTKKVPDQNNKLTTFDVLSNLTNKPTSNKTNRQNLFHRFCQQPRTKDDLTNLGQAWLESVSSLPISYIKTDGRWHYLDKKQKYGYKASLTTNSNNTPYLKLKYNDFRNGGFSCYFDSHQALSQLYSEWKLFYGNSRTNNNSNNHFSSLHNTQQAKAKYLQAQAHIQEQQKLFAQVREAKENSNKHSAYEKDKTLFNSLPNSGQSNYLLNKALPVNLIEPLIRYGEGFIIAQLININGDIKGWQKIFDDGTKKFTYGLEKKASFILLGQLAKKVKLIFVCEGLATGLTARLSRPDVPTVCALDAGNIMNVVQDLRAKFGGSKKCKIIILADNDQWKANQLNPISKLPIGNTGLIKANKTALKHRCLVATPNFDNLNTSTFPTDFNDLLQLTNISEVKRQLKLATRANPTYACLRAYETEKN